MAWPWVLAVGVVLVLASVGEVVRAYWRGKEFLDSATWKDELWRVFDL